jgi:hypothetical protein
MNAVVTSHLPVCLYSVAGKKVNRQDFYTRRTVACTRCAVDRRDQIVTLQGGTTTRSETNRFSTTSSGKVFFGPSASRSLRDFFHGSSSLQKTI